jgi:uncharacterized damage-inducible protein DinB
VTDHLRKLIDHLKWADTAVLRALRSSPPSSDRSFDRALSLYAHVLAAEAVWLARMLGRPPDVAIWPALSVDEAAALGDRTRAELDAFLASLGPGDAAREIDYRNSAGKAFRSTIEDVLLHVALHGAYHRGQVALVMREDGGEPAPTDYIAFTRGAPAARTSSGTGPRPVAIGSNPNPSLSSGP